MEIHNVTKSPHSYNQKPMLYGFRVYVGAKVC